MKQCRSSWPSWCMLVYKFTFFCLFTPGLTLKAESAYRQFYAKAWPPMRTASTRRCLAT